MKAVFRQADEIPVTLVIAVAYVSLAAVTGLATPDRERLAEFGWLTGIAVAGGEPWRLLAHAFLHSGALHLAFNTYILLQAGPALERALGSLRFLALYLLAALGGALAVCLWYDPGQPVVGGSGALFGLLGAHLALAVRAGRHALQFLNFAGPRALLSLIAVNLLIGLLVPFVSNTAHVGGLLTGFAATLLLFVPPRRPGRWFAHARLAFVAVLLSLAFHAIAPVTRYDWLWNRSIDTADPEQRGRLQRAAAMAWFGTPRAGELEVEVFYRTVVAPPDEPR